MAAATTRMADPMEDRLVADRVPKRIKELQFGILSKKNVVSQAVVEVCDRALYDLSRERAPRHHGPLDVRMGPSEKNSKCPTCGEAMLQCNGHFGHVRLALPAFHVGFFKTILAVLQQICKHCSAVLLSPRDREHFLRRLRRPDLESAKKREICKKVLDQCKKAGVCPRCYAVNGTVKKLGSHPLKIVHDKYRQYNATKKQPPPEKQAFDRTFREMRRHDPDTERHHHKAMDDMNPLRVLNLFRKISDADSELLGLNPEAGRPEMFIWQYVPAPPIALRASVHQDTSTTEDDLTSKLSDIVHISTLIKEGLGSGKPIHSIMELWDHLQLQIALYINSDVPGLQQAGVSKSIRGFCQRLKGKQGRFRGNLSGKRVDFSGRTVISPDPNLAINEVAVPELIAKNMTYPERVTRYNIEKMRQCVINGHDKWPGAINIIKKGSPGKLWLKYGNRTKYANDLKAGDVVERHLEDGDIVLFNRQPSLHKLSILSHYVKVRPHRTFRLNECVCTPYNADFDGDEMNLHVPQTEEARTEAVELMGVKYNLATPKNGDPIISAIQDFITASYLLSSKDVFYDRRTFTQICMYMLDGREHLDLPSPAIFKPEMLWTGKQVFNVLMRPNRKSTVLVNFDGKCKEFRGDPKLRHDHSQDDQWLCVRNSEIMCGVMDKYTIGSGKKDSLFYVILRDYGPDAAITAMGRMAKLCARWLTNQGFSIGISDVYPGGNLLSLKSKLIQKAYAECEDIIRQFQEGRLERAPGCNEEETMETKISSILTKVRDEAGNSCISELSRWNSPLIMAMSGSKGSKINVAQMVAVVGQQIIGGKRVQDGFQDRTLPHFPKYARQPPSKGFVRNSFFSGLHPSEFLFHAISGREGLVDTAVKTAETGYMSRRLIKSLEDLSTQYDDTVRNSSSQIIQFQFGQDKLDPVDMEDKAKPVHFERTFTHSEATTWDNEERSLLPYEIREETDRLLEVETGKLARTSDDGKALAYQDGSLAGVDGMDSARDFLHSVERFVNDNKVKPLASARARLGLRAGTDSNEMEGDDDPLAVTAVQQTSKVSKSTLEEFVRSCLHKYKRAHVEPGHAVGAVAAQSIGEPGTQMTLKTFHFAGVAGMSITQGVPRIKEIINASKTISTPVITCELQSRYSVIAARMAKGRIEKTYLRDIAFWIEELWSHEKATIIISVDLATIQKLQLDTDLKQICSRIVENKKLKLAAQDLYIYKNRIAINVSPVEKPKTATAASLNPKTKKPEDSGQFQRVAHLLRALPDIIIRGHPDATRAIIKTESKDDEPVYTLLVEGYGLRKCMNTDGVDGARTKTNSVMEMKEVLGIEAARRTIIDEISGVMGDMDIDPRHMQLLADVMTYRGEVLGITRFGLGKMRDSVLQLASFEKTPDHLFDAAWQGKADRIRGVSECIIMGQTIAVGTGAFRLVRRLAVEARDLRPKEAVFESAWNAW